MDWIAFLHIFTIFNKILLFVLFYFKKNNTLADKLLAFLILLPIFPVLSNYIFYTVNTVYLADCLFFSQVTFSFFGPAFLFYCMEMTGQPFKFKRKYLIHLLPSIIVALLWLDYTLSSDISKREFINGFFSGNGNSLPLIIAGIGPPLVVSIYIILSAKLVFKKTRASKEVFTNVDNLKLNYIREFVGVMIIEIIILSLAFAFTTVRIVDLVWAPILGNLMYFYIIYKRYHYGLVFSEKDYEVYSKLYEPLNQFMSETEFQKYSGSALSAAKMDEYAASLIEAFECQKWYLDPDLNLNTLSIKSDIPTHYISQTINQKFEKNFFDFVNYYRVEEFKLKLKDPSVEHFKFEELAYMCGFNSKTTFQRAFKKHTGMSPTEFRASEISSS